MENYGTILLIMIAQGNVIEIAFGNADFNPKILMKVANIVEQNRRHF